MRPGGLVLSDRPFPGASITLALQVVERWGRVSQREDWGRAIPTRRAGPKVEPGVGRELAARDLGPEPSL